MNCLTNLFQRVHSLPVLSTRWSQRTWYQSAAWIEVKAPVQFPVSVQERICNISRAWPDVSHLINVFCRRQKWQILVQKVKNLPGCLHSVSSFTCQWSRNTCGSRQTVAGESLSGLGFSPCGCCRGTLLLPGEPSAGKRRVVHDQVPACSQRWPRIRAQQHAGNTYVFVASLPPSQPEKWTIYALKVARNKRSFLMQLSILDAMNNKSLPLVQTPCPTGRPLHHSSRWPTTSPLVLLADHFTTRPAGRPFNHLSHWPTTSPLVTEQTTMQLLTVL
nr:uncharacterized protein LOC125990448 isoform X2 [Syngnathus scovelli]